VISPKRYGNGADSHAMLKFLLVNKDTQISIRLDAEFMQRVDDLMERLGPVASRAKLLREAMRLGWTLLEQQYETLKAPPKQPSKRKARG
jgi:predicted DNA-binding protein